MSKEISEVVAAISKECRDYAGLVPSDVGKFPTGTEIEGP